MTTFGYQGWEEGTSLFPSSAGQEGKNTVLPSSKVEGLRQREREEGGWSAELIIKRSFFSSQSQRTICWCGQEMLAGGSTKEPEVLAVWHLCKCLSQQE